MKSIFLVVLLHLFALVLANCPYGYFLEMNSGTCIQCAQVLEGCAACINQRMCTTCDFGYGLFGDRCVRLQASNAYNPCPEGFAYDPNLGMCVHSVPYSGEYVVYNEALHANNGWGYGYGTPYVVVQEGAVPQTGQGAKTEVFVRQSSEGAGQVSGQKQESGGVSEEKKIADPINADNTNEAKETKEKIKVNEKKDTNEEPKNESNEKPKEQVEEAKDEKPKENITEGANTSNKEEVYNESRKNFDDRPKKDDEDTKKDGKKDSNEAKKDDTSNLKESNSEEVDKNKVEQIDNAKNEEQPKENANKNDGNKGKSEDKKDNSEVNKDTKPKLKENNTEKASDSKEISNQPKGNNETQKPGKAQIEPEDTDKKQVEDNTVKQANTATEAPTANQTNNTQETPTTEQIQNNAINKEKEVVNEQNNKTKKEDNTNQNQTTIENSTNETHTTNVQDKNTTTENTNSADVNSSDANAAKKIEETSADVPHRNKEEPKNSTRECKEDECRTVDGQCLPCNLLCKRCKGERYNQCVECVEGASPLNTSDDGTFSCACDPGHIFDMESKKCIKTK
eukprot:TRINITY_DN13253_c0_g1_i6.p1 TRINITY_DN13253_c0_g1~~TRINITY_DN13253_c0_g1_i6.p1  ORF type:complete len:566 (-),score=172.84 TRINITY_DN13253_c0_g1_i6:29-1726(-)